LSTSERLDPRTDTATLLSLTHLLVSRRVSEAVAARGHPVKPSHGAVFAQVDAEGSRLTDLARGAQMSPQAMGELVDELEDLGYVVRTPDPRDRRAKLIRLTPAGRQCAEDGSASVRELEHELTDVLGERNHRQLRRSLFRLLEEG
jgi:DNA-binding MarR family transcriptional regulator